MQPVLQYLAKMTGWHEFAEFTAEDVGTLDSGICLALACIPFPAEQQLRILSTAGMQYLCVCRCVYVPGAFVV